MYSRYVTKNKNNRVFKIETQPLHVCKMSVITFQGQMVEGEIRCMMISPTSLNDVIDIAKIRGCNVVIQHFHSWKIIHTVFHETNLIYSPGSTMYLLTVPKN